MKQSISNVKPPTLQKSIVLLSQPTVTTLVNDYLHKFYQESIAHARKLDSHSAELWRVLERVSLAGGKRLRPYVLLLAYQAYGGDDYSTVLPVAVAQELLHISMLIHDDIIDKDTTRHGELNVSGIMQQQYAKLTARRELLHYANSAAMLGGDLLLGAAHNVIIESQLAAHHKLMALKELNNAIFHVGAGEFLDMESSFRPFNQIDALHIIELKTSCYSFITPLRSGALLAGASQRETRLLEQLGAALGVVFQLSDDLLGVYGDQAITGKSVMGDIREGKHTLLMEQGMILCSDLERQELTRALGNSQLSMYELERVRKLLKTSGAKAKVLQQIDTASTQARAVLQQLHVLPQAKAALEEIIERTATRVQ